MKLKLKLGHSFNGRDLDLPAGAWTAIAFEGSKVLLVAPFSNRNYPDLQLCVWRTKKELRKFIY
jgi:hypothetical protein